MVFFDPINKGFFLQHFSDLKQSRLRILELLPDPHHDVPKMEMAIKLYFSLLRGFLEFTTSEGSTSASKLRHGVKFRWTQSLLGNTVKPRFSKRQNSKKPRFSKQ